MNPKYFQKRPVVSESELVTAYHRALAYRANGRHAKPGWDPVRFDAEYIAYVENGRRPTGGFGKHRDNSNRRDYKYGHMSYRVAEDVA